MSMDIVLERQGGIGAASGYAGRKSKVIPKGRERSVSATNTGDEQWIGLVARVRDHQDRAAFASLFRHFAPRVKAFLMKSGAGEAMAEECTQEFFYHILFLTNIVQYICY